MMNIAKECLVQILELINTSHLVLKKDAVVEIYHHMGQKRFHEIGAVFINIVNREYCKSCAILLPGQCYPNHYHKIKIETFFVIYGKLNVNCEGHEINLSPGELMSIERGQSHSFSSTTGAVFEELSTTYLKNDSIYEDINIRNASYSERKTLISLEQLKEMANYA